MNTTLSEHLREIAEEEIKEDRSKLFNSLAAMADELEEKMNKQNLS